MRSGLLAGGLLAALLFSGVSFIGVALGAGDRLTVSMVTQLVETLADVQVAFEY